MSIQKAEMTVEQKENGQIVEHVAYPYVEYDHVTMENGMDIMSMIRDDVSTPMVTHNTTSWKVGQGDSDVSETIVDSSVASMTIKGQTYQNILPNPSLRNSMTNGKTMQKLNEGYDSVSTVDGVCKSAILKGNTLINCLSLNNRNDFYRFGGVKIHDTNYFTLTPSNSWNTQMHPSKESLSLLKPSTTYTLFVYVEENTLINTGAQLLEIGQVSSVGVSMFKQTHRPTNISVGINKFLMTTKSDFSESELGFTFRTYNTVSGVLKFKLALLEGDYTNVDIPYFEGMQSVKLPVLTTTGKNLINEQDIIEGSFINPIYKNGKLIFTSSTSIRGSAYFRVFLEKGKKYVYSTHNITGINSMTPTLIVNDSPTVASKFSFSRGNSKEFTLDTGYYYVRPYTDLVDNVVELNIQLEQSSSPTAYEPYKSNILSTSEDVELRGVGGVRDELNLLTGELTQRVGEIVLDGTQSSVEYSSEYSNDDYYCFIYDMTKNGYEKATLIPIGLSYHIPYQQNKMFGWETAKEFVLINSDGNILVVKLLKSRLSNDNSISTLNTYLASHPITINYPLMEPTIKTVDLSSSGNWEKVILDGSENWGVSPESSNNNAFFRGGNTVPNNVQVNSNNVAQKVICDILTPFTQHQLCNKPNDNYGISLGWNNSALCVRPKDFPLTNEGLTQWKQYLSQNPITVWYQTATHQDSTSVKEMLSFSNGHVQLSSAEGSLIPSLTYEVPTSNSYQLDLAKPSTRYTMKAKSASGNFTIDGTQYNFSTNGTFTTPSTMDSKLMIANGTVKDLMFIEGDVTSKTIPYFKGIKSAFEDEDKIEVLSTGKNLFDVNLIYGAHTYGNVGRKPTHGTGYARVTNETGDYILVKPNTKYTFSIENNFSFAIAQLDKDGISLGDTGWLNNKSSWTITTQSTARYVGFNIRKLDDSDITPDEVYKAYPMFEESLSATTYEPHKQNIAKIPLLSPLRSLPNGVCDELIIDRMKKKATLIQRVGHVILGQGDSWGAYEVVGDTMKVGRSILPDVKPNGQGMSTLIPYTFNSVAQPNEGVYVYRHSSSSEVRVRLKLKRTGRHDAIGMQNWLRGNNIITLYELETPIITEVNLEGYPFVYKGGHIFLNTEIAPITEVTYSINQAHQIESSNEDILRHQNEINHLYQLIAQYVQVQYEAELIDIALQG